MTSPAAHPSHGHHRVAPVSAWLFVAFLTALGAHSVQAAASLTETFSGPTLGPSLELSTTGTFGYNGVASNTSNSRQYIRTVETDYQTADFTLSVTYTVPASGGGAGMAFIGFGSGTPDSGFYGEPLQSLYFRNAPDNFAGGLLQPSINSSSGHVAELTILGYPSSGTHRAQLTKVGDTITFSLDAHSTGGTFTADYTSSFSQSTNLSFLNSTNSRLFVGSEGSGVTFDSFVVTTSAIPEPGTYAAFAGLAALGLAAYRRRRAT